MEFQNQQAVSYRSLAFLPVDGRPHPVQGLVKGAELCLNPYFWLAGEVSWLAIEVLSP